MAKTGTKDPAAMLAPLLEVIRNGRHYRLVARPGAVAVDRADGSSTVDVSWSEAQHKAVTDGIESPLTLADGCTATAIGGALVLRRPPDPLRRVDDLVGDGRVSALAGRTLSAALDTGRNILLTGPWCAAVELIGALLAEGRRPAIVGPVGDAVAPAWSLVPDVADALAIGADRIASWSVRGDALVGLMSQASGVVVWMDAGRLDRLLMRFESEAEWASGRATSPLQVLAAIDLVVVMTAAGGSRVDQVAEISLVEDGYRPRLLFSTGESPAPTALVPVGLPSFVDDLTIAGHTVLADELRHAAGGLQQPTTEMAPQSPAPTPDVSEPGPAPTPVVEHGVAPPAPHLDPNLQDAPPPGWELDRVPDEETGSHAGGSGSQEDAAMAATFGLAPPPAPPGVSPTATEAMRSEPTFEEALRRARQRDEELRQQEESEDA